jgi:hypothetical protein
VPNSQPRHAESPAYVDALIRYSERAADGGTIFENGKYTFNMEDHLMRVHNARLAEITFEKNGFTLLKHKTDANLTDQADTERRYYPEITRLVKELTGASEVVVFLGTLRGGENVAAGGPALSAHVDFTAAGVHGWIDQLLPDRAEELKSKRLVNINLWRPLKPVENMPLAVCDKSSVERADFLRVSYGSTVNGNVVINGGGLNAAHNPNHRWYYYPHMQPDEVLAFSLFDTGDPDWHMTAHTAFEDPTSNPNSPRRISYEVRTIAIFESSSRVS